MNYDLTEAERAQLRRIADAYKWDDMQFEAVKDLMYAVAKRASEERNGQTKT